MKKLILVFFLSATVFSKDKASMVQIKGSDTMVNLVQVLAEKYMAKNPSFAISVIGGGSGVGVAALINKTCDIANSSRDLKPNERIKAKNLKEIVLAIDGLSIIVHKNNKVNELTIEQLGKIYRGEIKNWKEIGGADTTINMFGRQPNSGTYDFIRELVVKADYAKSVKEMNGSAQIVENVKKSNNASGIGYVGAGYLKDATDIKVLKIAKTSKDTAYLPSSDNILNGLYPISRPLFQFVTGDLTESVKSFIQYELSVEGQKLVAEQGFYSISDKQKLANTKLLETK